ncbi:MAG: MTH1187 family thiamine-binding protein, partial [Granulosicoccaceae bacterium]
WSTGMYLLMDIMVSPGGVGLSVSPYVAECEKIFLAAGLKHKLHAFGTNVEGEWDEVMSAVKACHEKLQSMGAVRVTSHIKMSTRTDKPHQSLQDKVSSVEQKL